MRRNIASLCVLSVPWQQEAKPFRGSPWGHRRVLYNKPDKGIAFPPDCQPSAQTWAPLHYNAVPLHILSWLTVDILLVSTNIQRDHMIDVHGLKRFSTFVLSITFLSFRSSHQINNFSQKIGYVLFSPLPFPLYGFLTYQVNKIAPKKPHHIFKRFYFPQALDLAAFQSPPCWQRSIRLSLQNRL